MTDTYIPLSALAGIQARIEAIASELIALRSLVALVARRPEPVDACYADCISPDVPEGHDTVLGYLARTRVD